MPEMVTLDPVDREILALLGENARRTVRDIADRVSLTVAPVNRRIHRLERLGVITGYTAKINYARTGSVVDAMVELRFSSNPDLGEIVEYVAGVAEVQEVLTLAGDPDALIRIRVDGIEQLQAVVNRLRADDTISSTKTQVILETWNPAG